MNVFRTAAPLAALVVVAGVDRIIKYFALSRQWEGVFVTREFAGVFAIPLLAGGVIAFAVYVGVIAHFIASRSQLARLCDVAIALGGANNLFDRARYGGVIDWIPLWHITVVNLSDMLIITGAIGLLIHIVQVRA